MAFSGPRLIKTRYFLLGVTGPGNLKLISRKKNEKKKIFFKKNFKKILKKIKKKKKKKKKKIN